MTLEPGTCCYRAVSFFIKHAFQEPPEIFVVPTFSDGIRQATGNQRDIVVLPHVHETCSRLTTAIEWNQIVDLTFPLENPPLLLARRPGSNGAPPRCSTITRLKPLLNEREINDFRFEIVDTTQDAARACASPDGPEFCITNAYGAERHDLETVRILKHMTIWWLPFRSARGG